MPGCHSASPLSPARKVVPGNTTTRSLSPIWDRHPNPCPAASIDHAQAHAARPNNESSRDCPPDRNRSPPDQKPATTAAQSTDTSPSNSPLNSTVARAFQPEHTPRRPHTPTANHDRQGVVHNRDRSASESRRHTRALPCPDRPIVMQRQAGHSNRLNLRQSASAQWPRPAAANAAIRLSIAGLDSDTGISIGPF